MKKRNHDETQEQVNLTLDAFGTDEPPGIDPWFYQRLTNRINHELSGEVPAQQTWWSHVLKPSMLVGLVALNVVMIVWIATPTESTSSGQTNSIEALTTQYGLNFADTYLLSDNGE